MRPGEIACLSVTGDACGATRAHCASRTCKGVPLAIGGGAIRARCAWSRVARRRACAGTRARRGPCDRTAASLGGAAIERGRARRTPREAALPAAGAWGCAAAHGGSARRSASAEIPATRKVAASPTPAMKTAASPSAAMKTAASPSAAMETAASPSAAMETTASPAMGAPTSAATMTTTVLSECWFRRTSKCNKCKGCKQHFEEGGFSHLDYLYQETGCGFGARRSFDCNWAGLSRSTGQSQCQTWDCLIMSVTNPFPDIYELAVRRVCS
jgi:hypothetical protein